MAKKKRRKTAQQAAAKWLAALQGGTAMENYKSGTANKGGQAMANAATTTAMDKYSTGCQQSVTNGSRMASLNDPMSAQLYNANTGAAGAAKLGAGAQKKLPKYQKAIQDLQPIYDEMKATADSVDPTRSRATAAARAAAALQVLMNASKRGAV